MAALERLSGANADIAAAVEHAAEAIEVLSTSDARKIAVFTRHADGFFQRLGAARDEICAHAHLMDEFAFGDGAADGSQGLLAYRTRLNPARQRLHLANLVAASASEALAACVGQPAEAPASEPMDKE
ncbi:hypothetical protein KFE25_009735 [Diacronema lutheri]|uniref:Uncharacterized protein n=1 Tax=Diacronema lutheri TaxID=2081491 RepID=A0A8J5XVA2_DIALT|nr:hypothetical protein KFE25_009735 [Diacronema lutheri]